MSKKRIDKRRKRGELMREIRNQEQRIMKNTQKTYAKMKNIEGGKNVINPTKDLRNLTLKQLQNRKDYLKRIDVEVIEKRLNTYRTKSYIKLIKDFTEKLTRGTYKDNLLNEIEIMEDWNKKEQKIFIDYGLDKMLSTYYEDLVKDLQTNNTLSLETLKYINKAVRVLNV